jgi:hypothetical protein
MTTDLTRPSADPLERDLHALYGTVPSPAAIARVDARIARGLQTWETRAGAHSPRGRGRIAVVLALAAALALGGATGNLQALYALATGPFDLPWHRGAEIGLSQTVDGYRVTIDRAYADATRLALAISVVDEERRPGTTQLSAMSAIVTDQDGEYGGMGATSTPDGRFAAVNVAWKEPAVLPLPTGPRSFKVVIPSIQVRSDELAPAGAGDEWSPWRAHAGPWTFEFELDVDGGTTMTPNVSAEVDGVTVQVSRVIVAAEIVRVEATIVGAPGGESWAPIGSISHGGWTSRFVVSSFSDDGTVSLFTEDGLGDADGDWTITFEELVSNDRLAGPWVFEFEGP